MSLPVKTGLPEGMDLPDGYVVEWSAVDPTTGADVSGVVVSGVSIFGTVLGSLSGPDIPNPILIAAVE